MRTSRRHARAGRRLRSPRRLAASLVLAALAHVALGAVLASTGWLPAYLSSTRLPDPLVVTPPEAVSAVELRDDEPAARDVDKIVEALRRPDPPPDPREEEKKKEEEDSSAKGQVVDIERPAIEARPDQAKYLAEYDSRVAHETRGAVGRDRAGGPREIQGGAESHLPSPPPVQPGTPNARPGLPGPRRRTAAEASRPQQGQGGAAEQLSPDGTDARPGDPGHPGAADRPRLGEEGVPGTPGLPRPSLRPSDDQLARAISKGAGAPDWLGDVDDGESTALNAKKFRFASFFNRLKRDVAREWNPSVVYVKHDPKGNVYGIKDRVTVVRVHLRPDGTVASLDLIGSSGAGFLDDEAMDAFRRAAPFVNPPAQLVEQDGLIHFTFSFIFELSGRTNTKVFHYD